MKKLPAFCEEIISVSNKFANHKTKSWGHLGKVALVIYHGFRHLGDMYLQNFRITWKLPMFEKITSKLEKLSADYEKIINIIVKKLQVFGANLQTTKQRDTNS